MPISSLSRRMLLRSSLATSLAFVGFARMSAAHQVTENAKDTYVNEVEGYGPLVTDPKGLIDLPAGFTYQLFSRVGEVMDDGLLVPGLHDGMAAFPHGDGKIALVRNHEIGHMVDDIGPFGRNNERFSRVSPWKVYDYTRLDRPLHGGTTTLIYDLKAQRLESHFLSLAGTSTNCAGGSTPWGSWISCEETTQNAGDGVYHNHGYAFEVPSAHKGLVDPVPLKAMGRFKREAICIDPGTGIVYQTEDMFDGVFYRFLPDEPTRLAKGGRLQALAIKGHERANTSNRFSPFWNTGDKFEAHWIDLDEVDTPEDSLRTRAYLKGAARFARSEGIHFGEGELYFCCTSGGATENGQIMRYIPSPHEGQANETDQPGRIELFMESKNDLLFDYGDNITVAPWGHLYVCEDRYSDTLKNHLRIVTQDGKVTTFARNVDSGNSEWAGVTFSPDGSTLFANIQTLGVTVAITGPWARFQA